MHFKIFTWFIIIYLFLIVKYTQGPAEVTPLSAAGRARECPHKTGSNWNTLPKMSYGA